MKFIHAADLHIESPYKGIRSMNEELGGALLQKGFKAYTNLIDSCIAHQVDCLLIAGDSFDSDSGSLSAQYSFFRGLDRLNAHGIHVFIICGNHDPLNQWAKNFTLPPNVTLFAANTVQHHLLTKNDKVVAAIYGVSYGEREENRRLVTQFSRIDEAPFAIGLLHGTFAGSTHQNPYCPFNIDELRVTKMDYWALGHIHKHEVVNANNPLAVYAGNLQGRHFNETGEKGCVLVEVDGSTILSHQFISLSEVVFDYIQRDISDIHDLEGLFHLIDTIKSDLISTQKAYMLRVELTGMSDLYQVLNDQVELDLFVQKLNAENNYQQNFVCIDRIINHTIPLIDLNQRKQSSDFVGDVIRRFDQYEADNTLLMSLQHEVYDEIRSSKIGRYLKIGEDKDELKEILNRAKWKCIAGMITNDEAS